MAVFAHTFTAAAVGDPLSTGIYPGINEPSPATDSGYVKKVAVTPTSFPVRLSVPSLKINAAVQDVGITAKGAIGSPSNFTDVGWYEYGATPGKTGGAIIDGHVDNGLALAGVFKHLADIQVGAHIYIYTKGGSRLDFVVTGVTAYDYQSVPVMSILNPGSGVVGLSLITCDGNWVGDQKTYDQRLVVSAVLNK